MTAPADHGHFDPAIGLRWPVVGDSRLSNTRVGGHPFSALSGAVGATKGTFKIKFFGWTYAKERCPFFASDDPREKASKPSPSRPEK